MKNEINLEIETPIVYVKPYVPKRVSEFENDCEYITKEKGEESFVSSDKIFGENGLSTRMEYAIDLAENVGENAENAFIYAKNALETVVDKVGTDYIDKKFNEANTYTNNKIKTAKTELCDVFSNPNLILNGDFKFHSGYDETKESSYTNPSGIYIFDLFKCSGTGTAKPSKQGAEVTGNIQFVYTLSDEDFEKLNGKTVTLSYSVNEILSSKTFIISSKTVFDQTISNKTLNWVKLELGNVKTPFVPRVYADEYSAIISKKEIESNIYDGKVKVYGKDLIGTVFFKNPTYGCEPNGKESLLGTFTNDKTIRIGYAKNGTNVVSFMLYEGFSNSVKHSVSVPNPFSHQEYPMFITDKAFIKQKDLSTSCGATIIDNKLGAIQNISYILEIWGIHESLNYAVLRNNNEHSSKFIVNLSNFAQTNNITAISETFYTGSQDLLFSYNSSAKRIKKITMPNILTADIVQLKTSESVYDMRCFKNYLYVISFISSTLHLKKYDFYGTLQKEINLSSAYTITDATFARVDDKGILLRSTSTQRNFLLDNNSFETLNEFTAQLQSTPYDAIVNDNYDILIKNSNGGYDRKFKTLSSNTFAIAIE